MKIGGMGEEALRVELHEIRRLNEIPADVEIVRVLPPLLEDGKCPPEWVVGDKPFPALFLHIKHRYCQRTLPGAHLSYDSLDRFLARFKLIAEDEAARKGERVPEHLLHSPWVEDDA